MILTTNEQEFVKRHKDMLTGIFQKRIEELKNDMVLEEKEEERNKIRELIIEFRRWLVDIGIITNEKVAKKDTGI